MREKFGKGGSLSWLPVTLGVCALISFTIIAIMRLTPWQEEQSVLPPPPPEFTLPGTASGPQVPVSVLPPQSPSDSRAALSSAAPSSAARPTAPSKTPGRKPTTAPRTTPPPPAPTRVVVTVAGHYSVANSFGDSFIGQVRLTNTTGVARGWTATLAFPSNVGRLRASWVDGQPQPSVRQSGRTFTWTSAVPLAAGATIQLNVDFDRSGSGDTPTTCVVNGARCS